MAIVWKIPFSKEKEKEFCNCEHEQLESRLATA